MKYYLNFVLGLEQEGSNVIYNPGDFEEKPVAISSPEIVKMIENFVSNFKKVAIVESPTVKKEKKPDIVDIQDSKPEATPDDKNESHKYEDDKSAINLRVVSGQAYICQKQNIQESSIEKLCEELVDYLKKCLSQLQKEKILSEELNSEFAGMREALELRNYLARFVKSKKKIYKSGYIYIISDS